MSTEAPKIKHLEGKHKTITYALVTSCDDAELRLYVFLKLHAIDSHSCFPSTRTIKKQLGWSWDKTLRVLDRMVEKGRLKVKKGHSHVASVYDITEYDLINESGFRTRVDNPHGAEKYAPEIGANTLPKPERTTLPKPEHNNKKDNYKKTTTTVAVVDKSFRTSRTATGPESIKTIIARRGTKPV